MSINHVKGSSKRLGWKYVSVWFQEKIILDSGSI